MLRVAFCALIAFGCAGLWALPQKCPTESNSIPASIAGTLEYHPGVYGWYGLRTAVPVCQQKVISVGMGSSSDFRETHRFAKCRVIVTGKLIVPDTGYWSTTLAITGAHIQPAKDCKQGKPLPDYSTIPIPSAVKIYEVTASYYPKTYLFSAHVHDASTGKLLVPWQTYVSDSGNGARDFQRMYCAEGFTASHPKNVTQKNVTQMQNEPTIDNDMPRAIDVVIGDTNTVEVSFVCRRSQPVKAEILR